MDKTATHSLLLKMLTDGWTVTGIVEENGAWKVPKVQLTKDDFCSVISVQFGVCDLANVLMDYADSFKEKLQEVLCTSHELKENA